MARSRPIGQSGRVLWSTQGVAGVRIEVKERQFRWLAAAVDLGSVLFSGGGPVSNDGSHRVDVVWPNGARKKVICKNEAHAMSVKSLLESKPDLTVDEFKSMERKLASGDLQ